MQGNAAVDGDGRLLLARCAACDRVLLASAHAAHVKRCVHGIVLRKVAASLGSAWLATRDLFLIGGPCSG